MCNSNGIENMTPKIISESIDSEKSFEVPLVEIIPDSSSQSYTESGKQTVPYPFKFKTQLSYFNLTMQMTMAMNTLMMRIKPKIVSFGEDGRLIEQSDPDECFYYQGYEGSRPDGPSTMSLCDDGLHGFVMVGEKRILLEPSIQHSPLRQRRQGFMFGPHRLWESDKKMYENYTLDFVMNANAEKARRRSRRHNPEHLTNTKYIEMYFVNDVTEYTWLGRSTINNVRRMKSIANLMDSFYKPHNIRALLMGIEVWNSTNKIVVDANARTTLNNFLSYQRTNIMPRFKHDCALFVTHFDFTGTTIGLAPMFGMCSPVISGNINQDISRDFSHVAATMTHEMGHNLGMKHDGSGCTCNTPNSLCIMAAFAHSPISKVFSACSIRNLNTYLRGDMARCLMTAPNLNSALYIDSTTCGNNRIDAGEQCDCGLPAWCVNPYCNARTCRFRIGCECASGGCCKNCKIVAKGTVCRSAIDTCDIAERCDGTNSECPENLYLRDGVGCRAQNKDGYCYKGRCWNHNTQCEYAWGRGARQADAACYLVNRWGIRQGHCGAISSTAYMKCALANIYCGLLHCTDRPATSEFPIVGFHRRRISFRIKISGRWVLCETGSASLGRGEPDACKHDSLVTLTVYPKQQRTTCRSPIAFIL